MNKIASFTINHDTLLPGMYISRIDDDIVTYDIRLVKPNNGYFLSTGSLHTIEHLFATFARNSQYAENIVYVGPMGCRTGCYLLTKSLSHEDAILLVQESFAFISNFEGKIPGAEKKECGNYLDHDLDAAKKDILPFLSRIKNYTVSDLKYSD